MGLVFSLSFYLNELVSGGLGINGDSISASWLRSFKSFVLEKDNIQPLTGRFILKWQLWQCLIVTHCKTKQPQIFFHNDDEWFTTDWFRILGSGPNQNFRFIQRWPHWASLNLTLKDFRRLNRTMSKNDMERPCWKGRRSYHELYNYAAIFSINRIFGVESPESHQRLIVQPNLWSVCQWITYLMIWLSTTSRLSLSHYIYFRYEQVWALVKSILSSF